jgi:hypothetical protein
MQTTGLRRPENIIPTYEDQPLQKVVKTYTTSEPYNQVKTFTTSEPYKETKTYTTTYKYPDTMTSVQPETQPLQRIQQVVTENKQQVVETKTEVVPQQVITQQVVSQQPTKVVQEYVVEEKMQKTPLIDHYVYQVPRNFVEDSSIQKPAPLSSTESREKVIVLSEKKTTPTEYTTTYRGPVTKTYVRETEKTNIPKYDDQKNRDLVQKNQELENRLNYIKNYKEAVDENIEHNNEQSDIVLNRLNNRVVTLANDNNQLKERIRRGEDVGHELNKLDLTIDQIEQEHLDAIKGKLIEKDLKIKQLNDQLKTYTKETKTMDDYIKLKNQTDQLLQEQQRLLNMKNDLERKIAQQKYEIDRLNEENRLLKSQTKLEATPFQGEYAQKESTYSYQPSTITRRVITESQQTEKKETQPPRKVSDRKIIETRKSTQYIPLDPNTFQKNQKGIYESVVSYPIRIRSVTNDGSNVKTAEYDAEDYSQIYLGQDTQQQRTHPVKYREVPFDLLKTSTTYENPVEDKKVTKTTTVTTTTHNVQ